MSGNSALELEIRRLLEIEAIKRLKYRYIRCLTTANWDEMEGLLTEDVTTTYSDGKYSFEGREDLMRFLRQSHDSASPLVGIWQVQHPEITLTSDTTATGIWFMRHYNINKRAKTAEQQCAYYHDEYVKEDGDWVIRTTGYSRILEEHWKLEDLPSLDLVVA
jgi:bile-acid 7alpha-dehydratase